MVTQSRQDHEAVALLEAKTVCVEVDGVLRYTSPLLQKKDIPSFRAPKEVVMLSLRSTGRWLAKDPERATAYSTEIQKLIQTCSACKLSFSALNHEGELWYIPHHMVSHNGKNHLVFNFSFQFQGLSLKESLLPGPTLGSPAGLERLGRRAAGSTIHPPAQGLLTCRRGPVQCHQRASKGAYGSIAYLKTEDSQGKTHLSFLIARALQEFLGMVNFYHRFVPQAAQLMRPLYEALKVKSANFTVSWSEEMTKAFTDTKQALANATMLAHPLPNAPFAPTMDASD
ncbi:hypothetical protein AAFF_G00145060 [Aldrovandia affinis]|uniref:Uncharacterized protein n=1 Tax=Aldrovandia affinis TaxID=143900 RepID=A0AAD7T0M8_9TELE|nr:hypothetical protein AAFF_G00145060 [Aldrovandia affinis]